MYSVLLQPVLERDLGRQLYLARSDRRHVGDDPEARVSDIQCAVAIRAGRA